MYVTTTYCEAGLTYLVHCRAFQDDGVQLELDVLLCCLEGLESLLAYWVVKLPICRIPAVGKPTGSSWRL